MYLLLSKCNVNLLTTSLLRCRLWYSQVREPCHFLAVLKSEINLVNISSLRSFCSKFRDLNISKLEYAVLIKSQYLAKQLGCTRSTAATLLKVNESLLTMTPTQISKSVMVIKNIFTIEDILNHPKILSINPGFMEQRHQILKEVGFTNITPGKIVQFSKLMAKSPHQLKKNELLPALCDPLKNMLSYLDCPLEITSQIKAKHPTHLSLTASVLRLKKTILLEFLAWRLECSIENVLQMIDKYPSIGNRSLYFLKQTLHILTNDYRFPLSKIRGNSFVLICHPTNLLQILERIPQLGGKDVREVCLKCPRILSVNVENLKETSDLLYEYGINNSQIHKCANIFTLSPKTVKHRLEELNRVAEFQVMKSYERILFLVYYQNKAKQRLQMLNSLGFVSVSLDMLSCSATNFKKFMYFGEDRCLGKESITYLANQLNKTDVEIKQKLQVHPNMYRISLLNAKKVVQFLLNQGFTREQIWKGIPIVLYNISVVEEHLKNLPDQEEVQPFIGWKTNPNVIHLLLYYIERNTRFTGEGVYQGTMEPRHGTKRERKLKLPSGDIKYGYYPTEGSLTLCDFLNEECSKKHLDDEMLKD
ncbi:mitochondrial transcription termination factor 5 [Tachypleus tridentatus]|uniref:mitochondrial transcription termination factor 5 n=1 Tax=Tachypleus tridentatus TaxID=6853 RepID=UPI003FD6A52A